MTVNNNAKNPIIWADVPDPSVIRVGDTYYMSSTTMHMNPGVPIMKSQDLVNWEIVNYVYDVLGGNTRQRLVDGENEYGRGSWASCLRYHKGFYYAVFSSQTAGNTFIFKTADIEKGPWEKHVIDFTHDMSLLFDDDGRTYLVYGAGDIRILELTSDATAIKPNGLNQVIIPNSSLVAGPNIGLPAEGAHIHKINGKYYVFLITWPKGGMRTQLCYRADTITGPWEGRVVLEDAGIAQGGLVDTPGGKWYALLFGDRGAVGRIPYLIPVNWKDDWPALGVDGKVPQTIQGVSSDRFRIVSSDHFHQCENKVNAYHTIIPDEALSGENDANGSNLDLVWQWNHNPDNNNWSLTERPGFLRLKTGSLSESLVTARNTLTQRTFGPECSGSVLMDVSNMRDGDYAGLGVLQKNYGFVGIKMSDTNKSIVMVDGSLDEPSVIESVALAQDRIYFKIECDFKGQKDVAQFYYSEDGNRWTTIGHPLKMTYTLPHFMGYRYALFNFATKHTGGYVDFDYFNVSNQITGTNDSMNILQAQLDTINQVKGIPETEVEVDLKLEGLPKATYNSLEILLSLPSELSVTNVNFNLDQISGDCVYKKTGGQLKLKVSGNKVSYDADEISRFATIECKINKYIATESTLVVSLDSIVVGGVNVAYNVHDVRAKIQVEPLDSGAIAKVPGFGNPLITHKFGADPYAVVYDDRVYIYLSSDAYVYGDDGNLVENNFRELNKVVVISSEDLINWTDHGAIPVAGIDNLNEGKGLAKWAWGSWAPAATHKRINGEDKFFLYFSNTAGGLGVLTADSPIGPWRDPLGHALISHETPGVEGVVWLFDPAVLVDDDGTGYLYFGGGLPGGRRPTPEQIANPRTARVIRLGDDMISTVGEAKLIDAPYMFENSGIHKYDDKYYYTYCTNFGPRPQNEVAPAPGEITYMISDNPMGPFRYMGSVLKNPHYYFGVGGNNHHAIFQFKDQWYIVYHAQTVAQAILGDGKGYRSPHINKVHFYDNGLMREIIGDRTGVSQPISLNPFERVEAETIAWSKGILTEECSAAGPDASKPNLNVTEIDHGDWIAVANVDFKDQGATKFKAHVAPLIGGQIEIRINSPEGKIVGTLNVPTGESQEWQLMECEIEKIVGVHNVFFVFKAGEQGKNNLFKFDYWQFS